MMEATELPFQIKDKWLRMGVANSDKYLFLCHDIYHNHVPFSQVRLLALRRWRLRCSFGCRCIDSSLLLRGDFDSCCVG